MRKSRVIALVVASLVSAASFARAQSPAPNAQAQRHAMGARAERGEGRGARGLFRGVNLSDAEKAQLKTIRSRYEAEGKSLRESLKPAMQEARADRQRGDTAAARAVWDRNKSGRDQLKALHDREIADMRGALSAENQKQFDANVQQMKERRSDWAKNGKGGHRGLRGAGKVG